MKGYSIFILLFVLAMQYASSQNNLNIHFSIAQGNSAWKFKPLQIAETNQTGDTANLIDADIHANCPTVTGSINIGYQFNRLHAGIGFTVQHYFLNEFITDAIYFEESNITIPVVFSSYNEPQPTHFKFYPFIEYAIVKEEKFELSVNVSGGTFFTHSVATDSLEGFHWFVNSAFNLQYNLNERLSFSIAPVFDYSRLNSNLFDDPAREEIYINIYSFVTQFGVSYHFK